MGGEGSGTPKAELLKLDGTQIDHQGVVSKTDYFNFLQLPAEHNARLDKVMTPEQALKFRNHVVRMKVGTSAIIPMLCGGTKCPMKQCPFHAEKNWPLAEQCHPPGTQIKVTNGESVTIESLDPEIHKIVSFHRKKHRVMTNWKNGYSFNKTSRMFKGNLIRIIVANNSHLVTPDHIAIVRFNEKSIGKFCVYLMRKGNHWRIGKSRINAVSTDNKHYLPFVMRGLKEEADAMWILGTYDLNTEALLAEEYFSIKWQTSKVSFSECLEKIDSKYNGLYRWATKEQIVRHHDSLANSEDFYRKKLQEIGLMLEYPIWQKDNCDKTTSDIKVYAKYAMYIRACNIIPNIMEAPLYPQDAENNLHTIKTVWASIETSKEPYEGLVYSLDVKNDYKTYFANNIATHNCPIELNLIVNWIQSYVEDLGVDPGSRTQMILVNKLVECDIIDYRANIGFAVDEEAWSLIKTNVMSDGERTTEIANIHPLIDIKEKIHRVRAQILESLAATPKEKYKRAAALKRREEENIGEHFNNLKKAINAATARSRQPTIDKLKEEVKEPEVVDADWSDGSL